MIKSSYAEAVKRPAPPTPKALSLFNQGQTNELFRRIQGLDGQPEAVVRQFSCKLCEKFWWRRVRAVKQVSQCKRCSTRYDPIPVDLEFGLGRFKCRCGNQFTGRAQMGVQSFCYQCKEPCFPSYIINRTDEYREHQGKQHYKHWCILCVGLGDCPVYKKIMAYSNEHESTGSTLASLADQNDLHDRFLSDFDGSSMEPINEEP